MLWLKYGVEWVPGSMLVFMPKASVVESLPMVQVELSIGAVEEWLSGIVVEETGEGEAVLGADFRFGELLDSTNGGLVCSMSSCISLLSLFTPLFVNLFFIPKWVVDDFSIGNILCDLVPE